MKHKVQYSFFIIGLLWIALFGSIKGYSQNDQFYVNGVLQSRMINLSTPETEWIKTMSKRYSPDTWQLLERYEALPDTASAGHALGGIISAKKSIPTFFFLKGNSKTELLLSMQTNIHEIVHAYFSYNVFNYANENHLSLNWDKAEGMFYISPDEQYFISFYKEAFFPSSELVEEIPEKLRTFRFETYINGFTSTQDLGIVGLLNEFNAYYIGSKYSYDLLEAYKVAGENRVQAFIQWIGHCQSTMCAFYEFEFYIREYLRYMKREYPDNYELLLEYKPFGEVYLLIRKRFNELLTDYLKKVAAEIQIINSMGQPLLRINDNIIWVKMGNGEEVGYPIFSEDRNVLKPILESDRYKSVRNDYPETEIR